jgi:hypothetical protein
VGRCHQVALLGEVLLLEIGERLLQLRPGELIVLTVCGTQRCRGGAEATALDAKDERLQPRQGKRVLERFVGGVGEPVQGPIQGEDGRPRYRQQRQQHGSDADPDAGPHDQWPRL